MARALISRLCLFLLLAPAWGQMSVDDVGPGDFPGLQLLPPGSVIKGVSLPRYENHRVSALITARELEVATRSIIRLTDILAALYAENGETTTVRSQRAWYDFQTQTVISDSETDVRHPNFSARGKGVRFLKNYNIGLLKGPVHTTLSNTAFALDPDSP